MIPHRELPERLTILCNSRLSSSSRALLEEGIYPHRLLHSEAGAVSGLGSSAESLEGVDIAFGQPDPAAMLTSETLRWAHISSAGITRYDTREFLEALRVRGVILSNSSAVYDEPCAEHLLAFIMAANRNLPRSLATRCSHRSPEWQQLRETCPLLGEQTALIFGYGAIAERLVELLTPFRMKLFGFRRAPRGNEAIPMISREGLADALGQADHVINILPDNPETQRFFNRERFLQTKPGAVFYNIGRGSTIDQSALLEALESQQISATWLDVTDPEPLPEGHPLLTHPRCHITPHVAGGHRNERDTLVRHFLENFRRFLQRERLLNQIV